MSMALLMFLPDFSTILYANSSGSNILSAEATLINEYRILIKEQLHLTIKTLYHTKTPKFKNIYFDVYSNQRKLIPSLHTTTRGYYLMTGNLKTETMDIIHNFDKILFATDDCISIKYTIFGSKIAKIIMIV